MALSPAFLCMGLFALFILNVHTYRSVLVANRRADAAAVELAQTRQDLLAAEGDRAALQLERGEVIERISSGYLASCEGRILRHGRKLRIFNSVLDAAKALEAER